MAKRRPNRSKALPYPTMSLSEIMALSVSIDPLRADDCHCWLWTTNQFIDAGFRVLEAWGFKYLAPIHWIKPSGFGAWFVSRSQTCLFGYRGRLDMREQFRPNVIEAPSGRHSQKPEAFYELAEAVSHGPRLELFARPWKPLFQNRPGWDVWGNEVRPDVVMEAHP